MLRTPSAWAPSSSDSSAIRFRSRVVQWTRHSRSRSCWIPNATDSALIRTRAIAESETLTTSTPASRRSRAASIVRSIRMLRGGSISTETTKRRAASSSASRVGGGASSAGVGRALARRGSAPGRAVGDRRRASAAIAAASVAPAAASASERGPHRGDVLGRRAAAAADDPGAGGEHPRRHRPEVLRAGGVDEAALEPLRQPGVRHDRAGRIAVGRRGPSPPGRRGRRRPGPAVDPDHVGAGRGRAPRPRPPGCCRRPATSSSPNVSEAMTGRSDARRASSTASSELVEIGERLEHDDVDAALEQAVDLLAERGPDVGLRRWPAGRASAARAVRRSRRRARRAR